MTNIYLLINGILYVIFALWCTYSPTSTSTSIGLTPLGNKGIAEYITVYGGLQMGLGIFFLLSLFKPNLQSAAMIFAACLYVSLALFRTYAMIKNGFNIENGWVFYSMECAFAVIAVFLCLKNRYI